MSSERGTFPDNRLFFTELKDLQRTRPNLQVDCQQDEKGLTLRLESDRHAYFVSAFVPLEGMRYSDNWTDLYPGQAREIRLWHKGGQPIDLGALEVRWR